MYQNLSTTSEAEIAFRQAIDNVGDAEQREQLRQAYIQVETQARTQYWYSFARDGAGYFLETAIELDQAALVKFFLTKYNWEQWFGGPPKILFQVIVNGDIELLNLLLNTSPAKERNQCWLDLSFHDMIDVAINKAQPAVIQYFYEIDKQKWQKNYKWHGAAWLLKAAKMGQLKIVQFLLTRDDAEQVVSNLILRLELDSENKVNKIFAKTIETITQACIESKSEKLFHLLIGKFQEYIATQSQEEQPELHALAQRAQERFAVSVKLSQLQHQRTDFTGTVKDQQKHQEEQINKYVQLGQKIMQQDPTAGLVNAVSAAIEAEITAHNSAKK